MNKLIILFLIIFTLNATAQTTAIPDPAFEQELIDQNIDSDGIVNGQVLTSDVENVNELSIVVNYEINDLTGIESFVNLEELTVVHTEITQLNVSQNVNLEKISCGSNMLTSIDVSSNTLLEEIHVGNSDVGWWNEISVLDLSNNPNIEIISASVMHTLEVINLKNGNNNPNMTISVSMWEGEGPANPGLNIPVCIQVDDEEAAQNNQFPYSEWEVFDYAATVSYSEDCALATTNFVAENSISLYPNPTSDIMYFSTGNGVAIDKAVLYDISGRVVKEYRDINNAGISVTGLAKGMYVVQLSSGNHTQTEKIIVE